MRRVAASSTPLRIVTNIRPAIPAEERIRTEGSFTNFQIVADSSSQQHLQLIANQVPDGLVRMVTVKVENHKDLNRTPDDDLQFAARPDRLFTIAVRYLGELEAAAYDSETETKIETSTGDINRYVESDEGAVAVATVSVSGGTAPYSYELVAGGLELGTDLTNMTVLIPASAVPSAGAGLKLTARIEIDDNNRADTDSAECGLDGELHYDSGAFRFAVATAVTAGTAALRKIWTRRQRFIRRFVSAKSSTGSGGARCRAVAFKAAFVG